MPIKSAHLRGGNHPGPLRVLYDDVEFDDQLALVNGKPFTGIIFAQHPNGQLEAEKNYKEGLPEGLQREWYPNGQLKHEWNAIRGHGSSLATEWYENGQMKRRTYCRFGWQVRVQEWTQRGQLCRDERFSLSEVAQRDITNLEKKLNITSWPEEEDASGPS